MAIAIAIALTVGMSLDISSLPNVGMAVNIALLWTITLTLAAPSLHHKALQAITVYRMAL